MITKAQNTLLTANVEILRESATVADQVGFMTAAFALATLPHSRPKQSQMVYTRKNGNYTLSISPGARGVPFGSYPRLILCWLITEIIRKKQREIVLGESLSEFMHSIGLTPTGGKNGNIKALKEQVARLFTCMFSITRYEGGMSWMNLPITDSGQLSNDIIWNWQHPDQQTLWESKITVSEGFFKEVLSHPVPLDLRALCALKKSPLALDLYIWSTYRCSYLAADAYIDWGSLQAQFGGEYSDLRNFRAKVCAAMKKVKLVYPGLKYSATPKAFVLMPSTPSVKQKAAAVHLEAARAATSVREIERRKNRAPRVLKKNLGKAFIGEAHDPFALE